MTTTFAVSALFLLDFATAVYFAGSDGAELFYDVPHHREISHGSWQGSSGYHPHGTGPWRAPATNTNSFARESQIDIMASRAGNDPLEYRLKHLTDKKMRRVLQAAAERFGWTPSKAPSGRGYGLACGIRSGAYVATLAEVGVDKASGEVQVKRVVHAQDMGLVINPQGAKMQAEGSLIMGLGYALKEEIHFRNGEILDQNFDTYQIPRFSWVPRIETVLIESDSASEGGGEPAIVCVGAVIANAIYDAVGARMFHFPMTPDKDPRDDQAKRLGSWVWFLLTWRLLRISWPSTVPFFTGCCSWFVALGTASETYW